MICKILRLWYWDHYTPRIYHSTITIKNDCGTATAQTSFLQNAYLLENILVESSLIAVAHINYTVKT